MSTGFVDTNIVIDILRKRDAAVEWLRQQPHQLSISPYVWMEIMYGAAGSHGEQSALQLLGQFEMVYPTQTDVEWAMEKLLELRHHRGVDVMDCLIAAICARVNAPLYTCNLKHMVPLLGANAAIRPYQQ